LPSLPPLANRNDFNDYSASLTRWYRTADKWLVLKCRMTENFASLRRLAIILIKRAALRGSIRRHRKTAAWSNDHLLTLLAAAS
jgi:hypothetical protein